MSLLCLTFSLLITNSENINTRSTKISFGSCIFPTNNKSILQSIAKRNPDLFIMSGDATYLDYRLIDNKSNLNILKGHFFPFPPDVEGKTASEIESDWRSIWNLVIADKYWIDLKRQTNIISVWDDHDYGKNDGTFDNKYRELAKKLYLDAMDVNMNDVRRTRNGVYYYYPLKVQLSDSVTKIIDIILLDIRYFAKENGEEDILGNKQWEWLQDILHNKLHGDLALIVSGTQIMPITRNKTSECWSRFSWSQQRLFALITEIKMKNKQEIVLISGDVHRGEIMQTVCKHTVDENEFYTEFTEVTSSGLTHSVGDEAPFIMRNAVHLVHMMDADGITQCLWKGINFGEIDIEWNQSFGIKTIDINLLDNLLNVKCSTKINPLINENKEWREILSDNQYAPLLQTANTTCYGTSELYTNSEKYWKQMIFNWLSILAAILPLFMMSVLYQCIRLWWKSNLKHKIA